jgi:hypothetical protein
MSPVAVSLVTYLWHYLIARMVYDQLIRPLARGDASGFALLVCVALGSFVLGRRTRRRA